MDGFERRKKQKREDIRRAAIELFQGYGFKKVSIDEIARKAGVSQVTIYNHFGSKDDLVRDCIRTLFHNIMEKFRGIMESDKSFKEKLELIVLDKTDISDQFQGELMQTAYQVAPEFVESFWKNEVARITADFCEEGKKQGFISPDISGEALQLYFEIIRRGVVSSSYMHLDTAKNKKITQDLIKLFSYGLNG